MKVAGQIANQRRECLELTHNLLHTSSCISSSILLTLYIPGIRPR